LKENMTRLLDCGLTPGLNEVDKTPSSASLYR
jgi:hypothetical protein